MIKLLLTSEKIDVNVLNMIFDQIIEWNFNFYLPIQFHPNFFYYNKTTAFSLANEKESIEIIKLLLTNDKLDVNVQIIIIFIYW